MVKKSEPETTVTGDGLSRVSLEEQRNGLLAQLEQAQTVIVQAQANANAIGGALQMVDQLLADHFPAIEPVGEEA